ncbi:putative 7-dehydrocholesterol reductase [Colletotrichum shisoi]|uniref:Putative 7-dehydrocholesterol reductase n=1 Tax=Colletotrichum shisoi TaxID=2078593 RepID=A0A5Q4BZ68_9PEZI|nr:putative 7-dehydrocholesterol reductase [Colletotrichum shisoi]
MADFKPEGRHFDLIKRGVKKPNVPGTLTFIGLRGLDPFLQYQLVAGGLGASILGKVGVSSIPLNIAALSTTSISLFDNLHLPLPHLLLLGMSVGSFVKQAYWLVALSAEEFPVSIAVSVSFYNSLVNSANSLLLLAASTSVLTSPRDFPGTALPYQVVLGSILYAVGMFLETASEWQRKQFKDRPENQGKVIKTGLWSWARHINYGGYAMWRAGYCMAASGFIGGTIMGVWQAVNFLSRGVPALNEYCLKRYGEQWTQFKKEVPWVLIPGIY